MGIAKNILGYLFALYCVFRLWIALDTAVKRQASGGDPIAAAVGAVAWLVSGGRVTVNQAALRQVVTVAFIALVLGNSLVRG